MSYFFLYNPKFWGRGGFKGGGSKTKYERRKKKEKKLKEQLLGHISGMPVPVITEFQAFPETKIEVVDKYLEEDLEIALLVGLL